MESYSYGIGELLNSKPNLKLMMEFVFQSSGIPMRHQKLYRLVGTMSSSCGINIFVYTFLIQYLEVLVIGKKIRSKTGVLCF